MANRWANRPEPAPGQGVLYWHVLLGNDPSVQALAAAGREKLSTFSGLHFTPKEWLHLTTFVVGSVDRFNVSSIKEMIERAGESLSKVYPIAISLGRVLYHPEAIVFGVEPDGALDPVYSAVRAAAQIGDDQDNVVGYQSWNPHVTLAYSTSVQAARPIIDALGRKLPICQVTIDHINLVIQEGPERQWNWRPIAEVSFRTTTQ
jgi:2'-5' RNA ligase